MIIEEMPKEEEIKIRKQKYIRTVQGKFSDDEFWVLLGKTKIRSNKLINALYNFMVKGEPYAQQEGVTKQRIYSALKRIEHRGLI